MSQQPEVNDRELINTRVLNAPPETVFAAWSDPEHLTNWWGPAGFSTTTHSMDLRSGGHWRFTMHGPDGRDYENRIEYVEVREPSLLVYRHSGGPDTEPVRFHVTVSLAPLGRKTLLTMRAVFETPEELAAVEEEYGASEGGVQTLTRLRDLIDGGLAPAVERAR